MSVVKSKRSEGQMSVFTKVSNLVVYTIKICSNEKHFPKHYRWCITNKIVEATIDINNYITQANAIYVTDANDYKMRKEYQQKALAMSAALIGMVDIAYQTFGIESDRVEYWTGLIIDVQNSIRGWKKSDAERYKTFLLG